MIWQCKFGELWFSNSKVTLHRFFLKNKPFRQIISETTRPIFINFHHIVDVEL